MAKKAAAKKKTGAAAIKVVGDDPKTGTAQMAKPESAGKGKKFCIHCKKPIAARSATCPECGKAIPPKNKKGKTAAEKKAAKAARLAAKAAGQPSSNGLAKTGLAGEIKKVGGIDNLIAMLQLAKEFGAK